MVINVNKRGIKKIYYFNFAEVINFQWRRFITVIVKVEQGVKIL